MYGLSSLRNAIISLVVMVSLFTSVGLSNAQQLGLPSCIGNADLNSLRVNPFVQIGYNFIGFNFNLPTSLPIVAGNASGIDFRARDAGVWMGSVGIDSQLSSWSVNLRLDANATKNIRLATNAESIHWVAQQPVTWDGSQLQWWDADGVIGYNFNESWAFLLGLRYDYLTVALKNPVNALGVPINFNNAINQEADRGDFLATTWIPYIGLRFLQPNYRAHILYSPFANPQLTVPVTAIFNAILNPEYEQVKWTFSKSGTFLEGYFEYDVNRNAAPLEWGLWLRATWLGVRGSGEGTYQYAPFTVGVNNGQSSDGVYSRYDIGGGIKLSLSF